MGKKTEELFKALEAKRAELKVLSEDQDASDEDVARTDVLLDEIQSDTEVYNKELAREARRAEILRSSLARPEVREAAVEPVQEKRGYKGASHQRNPYDAQDAVRMMTITPSEVVARGLDAIEQAPEYMDDDSREHITNLVQRAGARNSALIAKHLLLTGSPEYRAAFSEYMNDPTNLQRAALSLTSANGGYLVPFTLDPSIILTNSGSSNPYRQISNIKTTATNTWNGVASSGMNAAWLAEGTEAADASPTFSNIQITPQKATAWVFGSYEILEDSDFESEIPTLLADAKDRLEEAAFTSGSGSGQPAGVITGATSLVTGADTSTHTLVVGDVYKTQAALPPRFRRNGSWVSGLSAIHLFRGFDTAGGASYWTNLGQGSPEQLLGGNIYESSSMTAYAHAAAGEKVAVYGDFNQFAIVDRIGMSVMYEPMVKGSSQLPTGQGGWFAFWRVGSKVLVPGAFRVLQTG